MKEAGYAFDSLPLYHRTKVKMCEFKVNKALKCKNETAIGQNKNLNCGL